MSKKTKSKVEEVSKFEKIGSKGKTGANLSEGFYYLLGIVISLILIFSTKEFLRTINYLFVVIFAIIAVIKLIEFIMEREYEEKNYSNMVTGVIFAWIAMFIFKYGQFLFLEMLPIFVSLLLFALATSSITKYFDRRRKGNLILSLTSIGLGILLIFIPGDMVYVLFKVVGVYLIITIILDLIDYKNRKL